MTTIAVTEEIVNLHDQTYCDGTLCIGCDYNHEFSELEPWGDTVVERKLRECIVENIGDCPGVRKR